MIEQKYLDLLRELSTDESSHSGRTLLEHLAKTHDLLEKWENPKDVCVGGLFHSIYGTEYYKIESADLSDRKRIAAVIGARAEDLAFLFCTTDRTGFFKEADKRGPVLIDRKTEMTVRVSVATLAALMEIEVANYIEQFNPVTAPPNLVDYMRYMLKAGSDHLTTKAKEELAYVLKQFD
jgi:hypothetical protein